MFRSILLALAMLVSAPALAADGYLPGVDYFELVPPREVSAPPGRVEVVFRHQYTVSIFRKFEPVFKAWAARLPADVQVVRKPHVHYPHARYQARMFLALQDLGRLDLNDALYAWIWDKARYPVYHTLYTPDGPAIDQLNLDFALANGIDRARFLAAYNAPSMDKRVIDEEADSLWEADAMFVVGGRYATDIGRTARGDFKKATSQENYDRFFAMMDMLIAKVRAEPAKGASQ